MPKKCLIINAIPVTCIGEPIQRSNMMLACDCFDNFLDTYTTTRVKIKPTILEGSRFLLRAIVRRYFV
jgi:hypothetical protein